MALTNKPTSQHEQPFVGHLVELRDRLLRIVGCVLILFLLLSPFANSLYATLAKPLISSLPHGSTMIATQVAAPFLTPFKFTFMFAVFVAIPFILYQLWAFIAPGLYVTERRIALPLLVSSTVLFYVGVSFAYFVVFPLVFGFLMNTAPTGVAVMTDISAYLDFVLTLFFAFGAAFEVPVATVLLIWSGVTTVESLVAKRSYIIVGAFVIGMIFTPPDVLSQILLAVPICLLFEVGLLAAKWLLKTNPAVEAEVVDDQRNGP